MEPQSTTITSTNVRLIPLWIKIPYTLFVAALAPVYLYHYGPANFLYFCDIAVVLTLLGMWLESPLLLSAPLVGIFLVQMLWVVDFFFELSGNQLTGMTHYMFDERRPFYLRFLSFFHFWLPFFLIVLVYRTGFDKRGTALWTCLTWVVLPICFYLMPGPGLHDDPNAPVNINYVYGFSDVKEQTIMDRTAYFALLMVAVPVVLYLPAHLLFGWLIPKWRGRKFDMDEQRAV